MNIRPDKDCKLMKNERNCLSAPIQVLSPGNFLNFIKDIYLQVETDSFKTHPLFSSPIYITLVIIHLYMSPLPSPVIIVGIPIPL